MREELLVEEMNEVGEFHSLNFILDHEDMDFIGYEFEGEELYIAEQGTTESLFRLEMCKETFEATICVAYSEDFDVMEEVTDFFDIDKLKKDIQNYMLANVVDNQGKAYVRYCALREEGYSCESAISMAYDDDEEQIYK